MTQFLICTLCLFLFFCSSEKSEKGEINTEPENYDLSTITDSLLSVMPYSIQIAAFQNQENAFKLKSSFGEMGIDVFIIESLEVNGKIYRSYAGPYASPDEVEVMLPKIQQLGYPQAFVKLHHVEINELDSLQSNESIFIDGDKRQITTVGGCSNPSWSPTGREIAFVWQTGGKKGIYAVGTSGGPLSRIVEARSDFTLTGEFTWSPDGNAIAFIGREFNGFNEHVENLFVMRKKQNKPIRMTAQNRFSFKIKNMQWSPNGQFIAFDADYEEIDNSEQNGNKIFYREIADESYRVNNLDDFDGDNSLVGWQSNSSLLFFSIANNYEWNRGANDALKRFDVTSQESEVVTRFINVEQLVPIALVKQRYIVSTEKKGTGLSRLISFDITNREKFILYELDLHGNRFPEVKFSQRDNLFFTVYDKLWQCTVFKREAVHPLSTPILNFTVSPGGKRICFSENGNLYAVRVP